MPDVAPFGTIAVIDEVVQLEIDAEVPLKVTEPCEVPKLLPVNVMLAPMSPVAGVNALINGAGTTVNATALLAIPPTVTTTLPVDAPVGTTAAIELELQDVILEADTPLNLTELAPWEVPKFLPVMVTVAPTAPLFGESAVIDGAGPANPMLGLRITRETKKADAIDRRAHLLISRTILFEATQK